MSSGRLFQRFGPAEANYHSHNFHILHTWQLLFNKVWWMAALHRLPPLITYNTSSFKGLSGHWKTATKISTFKYPWENCILSHYTYGVSLFHADRWNDYQHSPTSAVSMASRYLHLARLAGCLWWTGHARKPTPTSDTVDLEDCRDHQHCTHCHRTSPSTCSTYRRYHH